MQVDELSEQLVKAQAQSNAAQSLQSYEAKARTAQAACARKVNPNITVQRMHLSALETTYTCLGSSKHYACRPMHCAHRRMFPCRRTGPTRSISAEHPRQCNVKQQSP